MWYFRFCFLSCLFSFSYFFHFFNAQFENAHTKHAHGNPSSIYEFRQPLCFLRQTAFSEDRFVNTHIHDESDGIKINSTPHKILLACFEAYVRFWNFIFQHQSLLISERNSVRVEVSHMLSKTRQTSSSLWHSEGRMWEVWLSVSFLFSPPVTSAVTRPPPLT